MSELVTGSTAMTLRLKNFKVLSNGKRTFSIWEQQKLKKKTDSQPVHEISKFTWSVAGQNDGDDRLDVRIQLVYWYIWLVVLRYSFEISVNTVESNGIEIGLRQPKKW